MMCDLKECCCKCQHHKTDYHHCGSDPDLRRRVGACICNTPKGFACTVQPDRIYSNWPEHSSCELFIGKSL